MYRMLIIDDSEDICFSISEFFKLKNFEVATCNSIEEGLKILRTNYFDIIIIDYNMPYINGVIGTKLIRQINETTPIIALTIEACESIAQDFFQAGVNDFAIKPVKMLDLFSRVNVHLDKGKPSISNGNTFEHPKGIDKNTYYLIENALKSKKNYLSVEDLSLVTGVASKTVNRYLNYMVEINKVKINIIYGKIGRPKKEYLFNY